MIKILLIIALCLLIACQSLPIVGVSSSQNEEEKYMKYPLLLKNVKTKSGLIQDTIVLKSKIIGIGKNYSLSKGDTLFIPFVEGNLGKNIEYRIKIFNNRQDLQELSQINNLLDLKKGYRLDDGLEITIENIINDFPKLKPNNIIEIIVTDKIIPQNNMDLIFIYKYTNQPIIIINSTINDTSLNRDTIYSDSFVTGKEINDYGKIIIPFSNKDSKLSISISLDRLGNEKEGYKILDDILPNPFIDDKNFVITIDEIKKRLDIPPFHYIRIKVTKDDGNDRDYMFKYIDHWSYLGISAPVFLKLDGKPSDLSIEKFLPGLSVRWLQRNFEKNQFQYINTGFLFSLIPKTDKPTYSFVFGLNIDLGGWFQFGYIYHFGDERGYLLFGLRPDLLLKLVPTLF